MEHHDMLYRFWLYTNDIGLRDGSPEYAIQALVIYKQHKS